MWIEKQSKLWIENEKEWKKHCLNLHLQFGQASYSKIVMLNKVLKEDQTFNKFKKKRLSMLKKICEECTVCIKYGRTTNQKVFGRNVESANNIEEMNQIQLEEAIANDKLGEIIKIQRKREKSWKRNMI